MNMFLRYMIFAGKMLLLLVVGMALALIPVFDVIFTDKHSRSDYVFGLVIVGCTFLVVAGIAALLTRSWRFPFWLTPPSILVLLAYSQRETQQIPYHVAVFLVLTIGTAVGAVMTARF